MGTHFHVCRFHQTTPDETAHRGQRGRASPAAETGQQAVASPEGSQRRQQGCWGLQEVRWQNQAAQLLANSTGHGWWGSQMCPRESALGTGLGWMATACSHRGGHAGLIPAGPPTALASPPRMRSPLALGLVGEGSGHPSWQASGARVLTRGP